MSKCLAIARSAFILLLCLAAIVFLLWRAVAIDLRFSLLPRLMCVSLAVCLMLTAVAKSNQSSEQM